MKFKEAVFKEKTSLGSGFLSNNDHQIRPNRFLKPVRSVLKTKKVIDSTLDSDSIQIKA
jgi:hypothetical protein